MDLFKRAWVGFAALSLAACPHAVPQEKAAPKPTLAGLPLARHSTVVLDAARCSLTLTTRTGTGSVPLEGLELQGEVPAEPCLADSCPAAGKVMGVMAAGDAGTYFSPGSFYLGFSNGRLTRDSVLSVPAGAEGSACGTLIDQDAGACWTFHTEQPLTGTLDFAARRFALSGALVAPGARLAFVLEGKVSNQPPTARVGPELEVPCDDATGATVSLDGSASSDPDGDELHATWRVLEGALLKDSPAPDGGVAPVTLVGRELTVRLHVPRGTHLFQLAVSDAHLAPSLAKLKVTVGPQGCGARQDAGAAAP